MSSEYRGSVTFEKKIYYFTDPLHAIGTFSWNWPITTSHISKIVDILHYFISVVVVIIARLNINDILQTFNNCISHSHIKGHNGWLCLQYHLHPNPLDGFKNRKTYFFLQDPIDCLFRLGWASQISKSLPITLKIPSNGKVQYSTHISFLVKTTTKL